MSLCCTDGPATEADGPRVSAHVSKTTTRKKEFDGVVRCLIESQDRPANALRRSACRAAAACASATGREAGNRVEREFRGEFRQRVLVDGITTGVLSRAMDAASK